MTVPLTRHQGDTAAESAGGGQVKAGDVGITGRGIERWAIDSLTVGADSVVVALVAQVEKCAAALKERDALQREFSEYKTRATRVLQVQRTPSVHH